MKDRERPPNGLRALAKDTVLYGIADFAPRAANFVLLPVMTRFLSPEDYGVLALVQVVSAVAEVLYHFGAETAFSRFYAEKRTAEEAQRLLRTTTIQLFLQGCVGAVVLCALFPLALPAALGVGAIPFYPFGLAGIVLPLLYLASSLPLLKARMDGNPSFYLAFRLATFTVSIAAIIYFVVVKEEGAWGSIKGQLTGAGAAAAVLMWLYRFPVSKRNVDGAVLRRSLSYGFPLFLSQLSGWLFAFSDRILIQRFRTLQAVGMYQMGSNFVLPLDFFINAINFAWVPRFFNRAIGQNDYSGLTQESLKITGAVFVSLVSYLAILRPLITIMTAPSFHISYRIADILVLYYATRVLWCIASNGLAVRDQTKAIANITVASGAVQLLANLALIPGFGALGAALGTVATGIVRIVLAGFAFRRVWPAELPVRSASLLFGSFLSASGAIIILDFHPRWGGGTIAVLLKICVAATFYLFCRRLGVMFPLLRLFDRWRRGRTGERFS